MSVLTEARDAVLDEIARVACAEAPDTGYAYLTQTGDHRPTA
jgi:hypothetical protein